MFSFSPLLFLMGQNPVENKDAPSKDFIDAWAGASEQPMLGKVILALIVVMGLILLAAWLIKRFYPMANGAVSRKRLKVLETLPIGRKRMVQVMRVYNRTLVLGISGDRIDLLTELSEEEVDAAPPDEQEKAPRPFMDILPFKTSKIKPRSVGGKGI